MVWSNHYHWNTVGRITRLECCNQQPETVQKGQARKEEQAVALYVKKMDWVHRAAFEKQQWTSWELMGKKSGGRPTKETSWLMFTQGCPTQGSLLMKSSYSSYTRHRTHRLWSCWGTSTTLTSARKMIQTVSSPGDFLECTEDNVLIQVTAQPRERHY